MEGLYSIAPSRASSMSGTKCTIAVNFIAPPNGMLRSIYGLAGIWDSGQLTSNHIVMGYSVFSHFLGTDMDPYTGVRVEGASGDPLEIIGQTQIGFAISGLSMLKPKIVDVMICKSMGAQFLVGRKVLNDWNLSIHYQDGKETWQAGELTVPALDAHEAVAYNEGLYKDRNPALDPWKQARTLINSFQG